MVLTANLRRALAVAAAVVLVDRASKIWIVEGLDLANRLHIEVADPWLNLTMAWNHGVNFGLFDLGAGGALGAGRRSRWRSSPALLVWVRAQRRLGRRRSGAGVVVGGALGNVWDRLQWGAVADFLNMSCCGIDNPFAFNVADAAIFVGVAMLILFGGEAPGRGAARKRA